MDSRSILEEQLRKFGVDIDEIEIQPKKYLSPLERWEIFLGFATDSVEKENMLVDAKKRSITFVFEDSNKAKKFSEHPSTGLLKYARAYLNGHEKKAEEYDVSFSLTVAYEATPKNPKPNIVKVTMA